MRTLDLRTYRKYLSIVPQEPILFDGSVRENVTYGQSDVDDVALKQALQDANAWQFVSELPQGWDTKVGEKGALLSGGQKQRLAIATALLRNPRVLILDEATSALDVESESLIHEALARLMVGRTTFIIAHRLSTIRIADRIVVLDRGNIIESGSHNTLINAAGTYAEVAAQEWSTVVFSAKEAFFKLQFPHTREYVDFKDVIVMPSVASGSFRIRTMNKKLLAYMQFRNLIGSYSMIEDLVFVGLCIGSVNDRMRFI